MQDYVDKVGALVEKARHIRQSESLSCVIISGGELYRFSRRGVKDLYTIYSEQPSLLKGATIADKVVGKGAAVIMVAGGIRELYAEVISRPAEALLKSHGVAVGYGALVDNIINRTGDDICPVERLCMECASVAEALPRIADFIASQATATRE